MHLQRIFLLIVRLRALRTNLTKQLKLRQRYSLSDCSLPLMVILLHKL